MTDKNAPFHYESRRCDTNRSPQSTSLRNTNTLVVHPARTIDYKGTDDCQTVAWDTSQHHLREAAAKSDQSSVVAQSPDIHSGADPAKH